MEVIQAGGYKAGLLGTCATLTAGHAEGAEDQPFNAQTVVGIHQVCEAASTMGDQRKLPVTSLFCCVQVVECFVTVGQGEPRVEVLETLDDDDDDACRSKGLAASSTSLVTELLERGRVDCGALPSWPLPEGQHLHVIFNPSAGTEDGMGSGKGHAAMAVALAAALSGRTTHPGTVVLGTFDSDGVLMPATGAGLGDLRALEDVDEATRVVCQAAAALQLRSLMRTAASDFLRRRGLVVIGVESMEDVIREALRPLHNEY